MVFQNSWLTEKTVLSAPDLDPALVAVGSSWAALPAAIKAGILAMVLATRQKE